MPPCNPNIECDYTKTLTSKLFDYKCTLYVDLLLVPPIVIIITSLIYNYYLYLLKMRKCFVIQGWSSYIYCVINIEIGIYAICDRDDSQQDISEFMPVSDY